MIDIANRRLVMLASPMLLAVQRMSKILIAACILLSPDRASADQSASPGIWTQIRTTQGCLIYWSRPASMSEAEFLQGRTWSFEGTGCRPGQVLTGEGRLFNGSFGLRGRIANGVVVGEVQVDYSGTHFETTVYHGGCEQTRVEDGKCVPFSGSPAGSSAERGALDARNMPVASGAVPSPAPASTPVSAADGDVFGRCVNTEGPQPSGISFIYYLRNVCQTRLSLSYCLKADFEAAGDYNLCTRREYKTHSLAPGATVHFTFSLMPRGTALSDGRVVTHNSLSVRGYACANDASPRVHFDGGQFVFRGC